MNDQQAKEKAMTIIVCCMPASWIGLEKITPKATKLRDYLATALKKSFAEGKAEGSSTCES